MSDFNAEERADTALVTRLLGTLAQTASTEPGSDVELRLLRACAEVTVDLQIVDAFAADCVAQLILYLIDRQEAAEAIALAGREVELRQALGDAKTLAQALGRQSRALECAQQPDQALEVLSNAFGVAQQAGAPDLAVSLLLDRARILGTCFGNFAEALRSLRQAHDLADAGSLETRNRVGEQCELALSWILRSAGDAEDAGNADVAAEQYRLVYETARSVGIPELAARAVYNHARMLAAEMGLPDRALPLAEEGLALALEHSLDDLVRYGTDLISAIHQDLARR